MPLVPSAVLQFSDADGHPYAGGSIDFFVVGTTTRKNTWSDSDATVLNTNPVILDAAGRCIVVGDGAYRSILKDADGNTIWDQVTDSLVSLAMAPVCDAATLADARDAMGVTAAIAAEATRAEAAEATLQTNIDAEAATRLSTDTTLQAEILAEGTTRATQDTALSAAIAAETARAEAAEAANAAAIAALSGGVRAGTATSDGLGMITVTYATPFATDTVYAAVVADGTAFGLSGIRLTGVTDNISVAVYPMGDKFGFSGQVVDSSGGAVPTVTVQWYAIGY
jgi:hypothetical protein